MSARVDGRDATLDAAIAAAAERLSRAKAPLVYGLVDSTVEAQRAAVHLARRLDAFLDGANTPSHAGSLAAFQGSGALTTTLGEMRRRADAIVFWAADPDAFEAGLVGRFAPARDGRVRLAVDVGEARGPGGCDERLTLDPAQEIAALAALRALVRGRRLDATAARRLPEDRLRALAKILTTARYPVLVADGDPPPERRDPLRPLAFGALVREARGDGRPRTLLLRRGRNAVGAEQVLTWLTGFPGAIRFDAGRAALDARAFAADAVLAARRADAVLVVGADPARHLPRPALDVLATLPAVYVGGPAAGAIHIPAAPFDDSPGHAFRMDGVARRLERPAPALPTEADILARLGSALGSERRTA
jgi:formylmethanofuran dehydrogenase subunit B